MIARYVGLRGYPDMDFEVVQKILEMPMSDNSTFLLQLADEMCKLPAPPRGLDLKTSFGLLDRTSDTGWDFGGECRVRDS